MTTDTGVPPLVAGRILDTTMLAMEINAELHPFRRGMQALDAAHEQRPMLLSYATEWDRAATDARLCALGPFELLSACRACGDSHSIQCCPEVRAALFEAGHDR